MEVYGIDDWGASVPALADFTKVVSAEFAIRPFLLRYPERTLAQLLEWAGDDDPPVRRLASEGSRPRLPWGMALKPLQRDPWPILALLTKLSHDPDPVVRRSVANSLNDISRDHPAVVLDLVAGWQDGSAEVAEITRHGLRTLLKRGHARAMTLLGSRPQAPVTVEQLEVAPDPALVGSIATVSFTVRSASDRFESLMVDGVVQFARPRGHAERVFKWKTVELGPGETAAIVRRLNLRQQSTRTVHPGRHRIDIQVNGRRLAGREFLVVAAR